jgi:hypothetical protein
MADGIFFIKDDGQLFEMNSHEFLKEDDFQKLIENYPNLLAGSQIDEENPRRWLLVKRELGLPSSEKESDRWSVDHLFLDQDAIPTIVEVKRSSDTRIRREVVGQMLDYAANGVVYWPIEKIRQAFFERVQKEGKNPDNELINLIGEDADIEAFWSNVEINLKTGNLRLLFVADEIPKELRRIVEFLNERMSPTEILALQLKHYVSGEHKVLVPTIYGHTSQAEIRKPRTQKPSVDWNLDLAIEKFEETRGKEIAGAVKKVLDWCKENMPNFKFGKGHFYPYIGPYLTYKNKSIQIFWLTADNNGKIQIQLGTLKNFPPFDDETYKKRFIDSLNEIEGVLLPTTTDWSINPQISLKILLDDSSLKKFLEINEWVIEQIKQAKN